MQSAVFSLGWQIKRTASESEHIIEMHFENPEEVLMLAKK